MEIHTFVESDQLVLQIVNCLITLVSFILPSLLVLVPIRFLTKLPSFVFRKLLHFVAFTCVTLMILSAQSWQAAALTSVLVAVVVYPILAALEKADWFDKLFLPKSPGETKRSLLLLFIMFAVLITISWGVFGQRHLAAAAILMWGTGDAAAALVGIPFGKHKVRSRLTDGKKSWEGSLAMLLVSFASGMIILIAFQKMPFSKAFFAAFIAALFGTATELLSPSEYDTVTVPMVIITVLLLIVR